MIIQRVFDPNVIPVIMVAAPRTRPGRNESSLSSIRSLEKGSTRPDMSRKNANGTVKAQSSFL